MSTKLFALKITSLQSTTPPKDYILVLNDHLTTDEFVKDLHELYPAIPTADRELRIVLEGSYQMTPRQFLRYMTTAAAYAPEVEGGVCVPKLLGGGNGIKVIYKEGLEPAQHIPRCQSMAPWHTPPVATSISNMATGADAMRISENLQPLPSSRAVGGIEQPQARSHPPTHKNANHAMIVHIYQHMPMFPYTSFPSFTITDVPQAGGLQESLWLEGEVLTRLPEWLDRSKVLLMFARSIFGEAASPHASWNRDSFRWYEISQCWVLDLTVSISWSA